MGVLDRFIVPFLAVPDCTWPDFFTPNDGFNLGTMQRSFNTDRIDLEWQLRSTTGRPLVATGECKNRAHAPRRHLILNFVVAKTLNWPGNLYYFD